MTVIDKNTLAHLKYTDTEIQGKAALIYVQMIDRSKHLGQGNFEIISTSDLKNLFELYDEQFFIHFFREHFDGNIRFYISSRMTKAAGKTIHRKGADTFKIGMAVSLLFQNFEGNSHEITVAGLPCRDRLEAMMRTMEHEIVHLIEHVVFSDSNCSAPRFKKISNNIFGHTASAHELLTGREIAHKEFNLKIGDNVSFEFEGKTYKGIINQITKRATVMVENANGQYQDGKGHRYNKYYVPVPCLRRTDEEP